MDWNKQAEFGIRPLVLTQYTLIQVYTYYAIAIKGEILKQIWSLFYMLTTYYSWAKTSPRLQMSNVNLANCIKWRTSDQPHPIWGFESPEIAVDGSSVSIKRCTLKTHSNGSASKMQTTQTHSYYWNQDILPTSNWDTHLCHCWY